MPTDIYVAISPNSKNGDAVSGVSGATYSQTFASLTLALADGTYGARDLVALDQRAFYHYFADATDYQESGTAGCRVGNGMGAWVADLSRTIEVTCAPDNGPVGLPTASFYVWSYDAGYPAFLFDIGAFATVRGFRIDTTGGNRTTAVRVHDRGVLDRMMVRRPGGDCVEPNGLGTMSIAPVIKNSLFYDGLIGVKQGGFTTGKIYNCVAANCSAIGVFADASNYGFELYNVASFNSAAGGVDFDVRKVDIALNTASGDATATVTSGPAALINQVAADCFVAPLSNDFHLKAASNLEDAGHDVSLAGIVNDIDNQPWELPYSIGFDQPGAFTVPVKITALDAETLSPIIGADVYVYADTGGPLPAGTEITSGTTDANGEINTTPEFTATQPFVAQGRKGTTTPFYNEGRSLGALTGDGFTGNIYMVIDE